MGPPDFADAHPGYGLRLRGPKLGRKSRRENVLCWLFRQHLVARIERSEIRERLARGKSAPGFRGPSVRATHPRRATARAAHPSRAAEPVIGPATSGRTRWRPPQDGDSEEAPTRPARRSPHPVERGKQKRARRIALTGGALSCHVARP